MNTFDLFIILPIALGFVIGLFKGFVKEVVSLAGVLVALLAAEAFSKLFVPVVGEFFHSSEKMSKTVSYVIVFVAALVVMFLLSKFIEKIISGIHLGWLNSLAGGVFGALKFAIIASVLMNVFDALDAKFHFAKQEKKEESLSYYPILKVAPSLWEESKKYYNSKKDTLNTDDREQSEKYPSEGM